MPSFYIIVVSGSREWTDEKVIEERLSTLEIPDNHIPLLTHGGCRGTDMLADKVARKLKWKIKVYPANWDKYGKAAGPMRNQQMLDECKPHTVICFHKGNSRGTADMKARTEKYKISPESRLQQFIVITA